MLPIGKLDPPPPSCLAGFQTAVQTKKSLHLWNDSLVMPDGAARCDRAPIRQPRGYTSHKFPCFHTAALVRVHANICGPLPAPPGHQIPRFVVIRAREIEQIDLLPQP